MKEQIALFIECDCHCCGIQVSQFNDSEEPIIISFWVSKWYAIPANILLLIWKRIQLAIRVLRNGDYFLQDIILSKQNFNKLKEYLNNIKI